MLEGYVKKPGVGLCELVWNAFDEDATNVRISIEANDLAGIERVIVADDGNGMNAERFALSFATVGDSRDQRRRLPRPVRHRGPHAPRLQARNRQPAPRPRTSPRRATPRRAGGRTDAQRSRPRDKALTALRIQEIRPLHDRP